MENWMTKYYGLENGFKVDQHFVKIEGRRIVLRVHKVPDVFSIRGAENDVRGFTGKLPKAFQVGKIGIGDTVNSTDVKYRSTMATRS